MYAFLLRVQDRECVFHSVWMVFCSVPQIFTPALSSVTSIPCLCVTQAAAPVVMALPQCDT